MKRILYLFLFLPLVSFSQQYVSPVGFKVNETNQNRVLNYIKYEVKKSYSAIGMDDPSTLRMMEKENLKAFKELLKAKNINLLKSVEKSYCDIGMCNYNTILMMYKEQSKAATESLKW